MVASSKRIGVIPESTGISAKSNNLSELQYQVDPNYTSGRCGVDSFTRKAILAEIDAAIERRVGFAKAAVFAELHFFFWGGNGPAVDIIPLADQGVHITFKAVFAVIDRHQLNKRLENEEELRALRQLGQMLET